MKLAFTFLRRRKRSRCLAALVTITAVIAILTAFHAATARFEERHLSAISWVLASKLIVIDPGHGGDDPGALGSTGKHEKDIVLEVSKKLAEILRQGGAEVVLTRESDRDLSDPETKNLYQAKLQDLSRRVELANNRKADLFISIHVNSFPDPREDGAQTFSQPGSEESRKLAVAIQNELNRFSANPGREARQVDYFANSMARMPSVIIEIGFITNPQEEKLMLDPIYQNKIAWAIYAGIVRYFAQPRAVLAP
ncbi:N-acetylmuramoyl-L-alanine amidase [Pelotomaculum thermopropionicum SI]|uniref:N-acetylmuramoyl-L-alanine amidase n=1 Tax=Pelotomaculum thermopropionicum (strain DSM 13744 / JCM 10971 / SI) TaxID=370438 RepID=A5D2C7_PELTS|nr:N-acetylmuramoyl-L-alanine amidase [Pelotomaculum thermopropionicum SI]